MSYYIVVTGTNIASRHMNTRTHRCIHRHTHRSRFDVDIDMYNPHPRTHRNTQCGQNIAYSHTCTPRSMHFEVCSIVESRGKSTCHRRVSFREYTRVSIARDAWLPEDTRSAMLVEASARDVYVSFSLALVLRLPSLSTPGLRAPVVLRLPCCAPGRLLAARTALPPSVVPTGS